VNGFEKYCDFKTHKKIFNSIDSIGRVVRWEYLSKEEIRAILSVVVKIDPKHFKKVKKSESTAYFLKNSIEEIFEAMKDKFLKKLEERTRKAKYIKGIKSVKFADEKDIPDDYRPALQYDTWGANRDLVLRAYFDVVFEIDTRMLVVDEI